MATEHVVLVGKKPIMNYVVACLTLFNSGANEVLVKARGRAISRAVDAVELLRRIFLKDVDVADIKIGTEMLTNPEGQKTNVSTIDILLKRKTE